MPSLPSSTESPRAWLGTFAGMAVLVLGLALSGLAALAAWNAADQRLELEFVLAADDRISAIDRRIDLTLGVIESTESYLTSARTVDAVAFQTFMQPFLTRFPSVRGVGWAVREVADGADSADARLRYQLLLLEPKQRTDLLRPGGDITAEPRLAELLRQAQRVDSLVVAAPVTASQERGALLVAARAVYSREAGEADGVPDGFVIGIFAMADLVEAALAPLRPRGIDVYVYDVTEPAAPERLYYRPAPSRTDTGPPAAPEDSERMLRHARDLGGRSLAIVCTAAPGNYAAAGSWLPIVTFWGGLLLTSTLAGYLYLLNRQSTRVRTLVQALELEVEERRRAEQHLAHLAHHDGLTGLPNRTLFADRLRQAIIHAERTDEQLAVLYLDLDGFKPINDKLGHAQGDLLLVEIGQRLQSCVRAEDTVCRLGGDEFTVLLRDVHEREGIARVADKMLSELRRPVTLLGHAYQVTASIGISLYPDHGTEPESLLKAADAAMYVAKQHGKDRFEFPGEAVRSSG